MAPASGGGTIGTNGTKETATARTGIHRTDGSGHPHLTAEFGLGDGFDDFGGVQQQSPLLDLIENPWFGGRAFLAATLGLIAVLATITTIQRIVHVTRQSPPDQASAAAPGGDQHP